MTNDHFRTRSWGQKFRDSFRGLWLGVGQASVRVQLVCAVLVLATAGLLQLALIPWCLVLLCITVVLAAELFNSALESLARAIDVEHNLHLADGLDIASAAVLVAALGAAAVGGLVFLFRILELLGG